MREARFLLAAVLFALAFSGCVSVSESPSPRYYMPASLARGEEAPKFEIAPGMIIAVGPVKIPEYQDRPQIVTKNKSGTLDFAQFDRWAEPLDDALARMISDDLAIMLPGADFQLFPCSFSIPLDYQVIVDVLGIESELSGDLTLTAQWSVIDRKNKRMLMTKRSEFSRSVDPHNYSGLSRALGAVCAALSKEIAENLSTLSKSVRPGLEPTAL